MDETLALPSEKAAEIALRTQQILAYETGVANVADPLGGSWYVEELTQKMEEDVLDYFEKIDKLGGVIECIESGYLQKEIADSSAILNEKIDSKERIIVGMNEYENKNEKITIPILEISKKVEDDQIEFIKKLRLERNNQLVAEKLKEVENASKNNDNLLYPIIDAVLEYATLGEIVEAMKNVFGDWQEKSII